jgi:hypothetical protein
MSLHRGSRKARRITCYVTKSIVEELEQRQLLTTLHGGDVAEYQTAAGNAFRIVVQGPSSAQFDIIGATPEPDNTAQFGQSFVLNDIAMTITHPNGTVDRPDGGFGAFQGVEPIQVATGAAESTTDLIGGPTPAVAPSGGINIVNLSSDSTGRTYGINVVQGTFGGVTQKLVELVSINYKNVTANGVTPADAVFAQDLGAQIALATGAVNSTAINSIIGMDFLPSNDNQFYFAASVNVARNTTTNPTGTPGTAPIPFLLQYDFTKPLNQRVSLAGEFISDQLNGGFSDVAPTVTGITFTSNDRLVAFVTGRAVQGVGDNTAIATRTGLVDLDPNNPVFDLTQIVPVTFNSTPITELHSLEVIPGDDDFVFGLSTSVMTNGVPDLLHIKRQDPNRGIAVDFGPLGNAADTVLGAAIGDLDWNPAVINPFILADTGKIKKGALIAEDTAEDKLLVVDSRDRFPATNLFSIYGTHTTSTTSLSIAQVPVPTTVGPRPMEPFTGNAGPFQVHPAQPGPDINVTPAGGTGSVLIGALTLNFNQDPTEPNRPVLQVRKTPSQTFGNLPKNLKYVTAGITTTGDMDNILIGGTLTGFARINGSANMLYAGDFLTGDARGLLSSDSAGSVLGNIYVTGDLRNLITASTFGSTDAAPGTSPDYLTGFSTAIGGHLGQMESIDAYIGAQTSVSGTEEGSSAAIQEVEDRRGTPTGDASYFQGFNGGAPSLGDSPLFDNDTYQTAQFVGTAQNNALGTNEAAVITGEVRGVAADTIDYYAMGLMGGQTVTVQLSMVGSGNVTVFDPDQRLIDSDLTTPGLPQLVAGQPFSFTADRPGAYRFAVSGNGDYTLRITNAANVALGGVVAGTDISTYNSTVAPFRIHNGDAGAFQAGVDIVDTSGLAYTVDRGNLRSLDAPTVGTETPPTVAGDPFTFTNGMNLMVPGGSVGLMRATDAAGILAFNLALAPLTNIGTPNAADAIGGDYQLVDAAGQFTAVMLADRAIGTVRAGGIATDPAPYFIANADQKGQDGTIDLIDDAGDFGTLQGGGPHLYTGPGGNVRYIRVAGSVFKSSVFGGGDDVATTLAPGKTMRLIDDSGTNFKLSPTPLVNNPNFNGTTDTTQLLNPGNLSVVTSSVNDHKGGGVVVLNVTVNNAGSAGNHGLLVESGAKGTNGSVEIGTITMDDAGVPVVETPAADGLGGPPTIAAATEDPATLAANGPDATTPIDIVFKGPSTIDAWSITGNNLGTINNETNGEIVNVSAASVGDIEAQTIGLAKSHTGADPSHSGNAVNGVTIQDDQGTASGLTPFVQQRNLISIRGDLVQARSRKGIGNILVTGIIGSIVADSNHKNDPGGGFEGIDGPIVAIGGGTNGTTDARIQSVDIGRGVAFGGRGNVPFSGIFAGDAIQSIVGDAVGDDIRGPIVVGGNPGAGNNPVDGDTITSISLNGGAIIGSYIGVTSNFNTWRSNTTTVTLPEAIADDPNDTNSADANALHYEIGQIKLKGAGGVIGTLIEADDVGPITVSGGFGVLNSDIESAGDNRFAGINATGYGIRDTTISGFADVTSLVAQGTGKPISTNGFTPSVLISHGKSNVMDPFTHTVANAQTDLYRYLGTTLKSPIKKSISATGVIQDVNVQADGNLDEVSAYQIRHRNPLGVMNFAIGQNVGSIVTTGAVDGLTLSGDSLKQFTTGNNVDNTSIDISGPIKTVSIGGTLKGSSEVSALGAEGTLGTLTTKRGLYADVHATVSIGSIIAGADLGSHNISTVNTINLLQVGGSIFSGVNVANLLNHKVNPFKRLIDLVVAGNVDAGATIRVKKLDQQHIGGVVNGNIIVG